MKNIIIILFISVLISLGIGFYIKAEDEATGNLIIGLALMTAFFILMPLFIYHRWKDRNVKDYMLTKENILKMREYQNEKKKEKKS
jgi:flagellar biosynthesis protein FliP